MSRRQHTGDNAAANQPGWGNGAPSFTLTGDSGPDYTILASTNLPTWQPVWTNNSVVPPFQFTDPGATNFKKRFYRVLPGPRRGLVPLFP